MTNSFTILKPPKYVGYFKIKRNHISWLTDFTGEGEYKEILGEKGEV